MVTIKLYSFCSCLVTAVNSDVKMDLMSTGLNGSDIIFLARGPFIIGVSPFRPVYLMGMPAN